MTWTLADSVTVGPARRWTHEQRLVQKRTQEQHQTAATPEGGEDIGSICETEMLVVGTSSGLREVTTGIVQK